MARRRQKQEEPKIINLDDVTLDCHANLNMTNCVSLGIGVIGNITEQENNDVRRLISTLENKTNLSLAKGEIELLQLNYSNQNELYHHGVKGMKWGVRKARNTRMKNEMYKTNKKNIFRF